MRSVKIAWTAPQPILSFDWITILVAKGHSEQRFQKMKAVCFETFSRRFAVCLTYQFLENLGKRSMPKLVMIVDTDIWMIFVFMGLVFKEHSNHGNCVKSGLILLRTCWKERLLQFGTLLNVDGAFGAKTTHPSSRKHHVGAEATSSKGLRRKKGHHHLRFANGKRQAA